MPASLPPLSIADIAAALGDLSVRFDVDVLDECNSTNSELMTRAEAGAGSGTVVVARRQTAGRGRLGRSWIADPDASLAFSLLWRFPPGTWPAGLSLAVGVGLAEALETLGVGDIALKWPNDLQRGGRKCGGVLVELAPGDPRAAVIGIGINLALPGGLPDDVAAMAAGLDLDAAPATILARLLAGLHGALTEFGSGGFVALRERWLARCAHRDVAVRILSEHAAPLEGRCIGVDVDGALMVETGVCIQRILSGDVSLRTA